jgi:acetylornithine deacetylase/succinyl-diaminopimelate desuccinylase-like protein
MKTTLSIIFFVCFTFSLYAQGIDPTVATIINNVNADSLTYFVSELSGEIPVTINDTQYTIASRYDTASGNAIAALYISQKLQSYGLIPQIQDFSPSGRNVFAVQAGVDHSGQMYIICAHYDDQPKGSIARVQTITPAERLLSLRRQEF